MILTRATATEIRVFWLVFAIESIELEAIMKGEYSKKVLVITRHTKRKLNHFGWMKITPTSDFKPTAFVQAAKYGSVLYVRWVEFCFMKSSEGNGCTSLYSYMVYIRRVNHRPE